MSATRADVEKVMIRRAGKRMTAAGLDGTTIAGNNADLVDPILTALRQCGLTPASISAVTDADVALLDTELIPQFLDLTELRLLINISGNYALVDSKTGPRSDNYSQLVESLDKRIATLEKRCRDEYGIGTGTVVIGTIDYDFQQRDENAA